MSTAISIHVRGFLEAGRGHCRLSALPIIHVAEFLANTRISCNNTAKGEILQIDKVVV